MKYYILILWCTAFFPMLSASEPVSYRGWFAGAQFGIAENDDSDKTVVGVHGGFRFNRYFSLEIAYLDLEEVGFREADSVSNADIYGFRYGAVGMLPLTPRLSWMVGGGLFHHRIEEEIFRNFSIFTTAGETVGPYVETGLDFRLSGGWSTRITAGNYEIDPFGIEFIGYNIIFDDEEDLHLYQLSFSYQF